MTSEPVSCPETMNRRVFISHAVPEDSRAADEIRRCLEERGLQCWNAARDGTRGDWQEYLIEEIERSACLLLVLSEAANRSAWVAREVTVALDRGKPVIPVRIADVRPSTKLELAITRLAWIDVWAGPIAESTERLAAAVTGAIGAPLGVADASVDPVTDWRRAVDGYRAVLDRHFDGHARVLGAPREPPVLRNVGELALDSALAERASLEEAQLAAAKRDNETQAVLDHRPRWAASPLTLRYRTAAYAAVRAMRKIGACPVLSACAVIVVPRENELLLHLRAPPRGLADTYARLLHTFGGAFIPPLGKSSHEDESFADTIQRETREESRNLVVPEGCPAVLTEEIQTGFIQCVYLGIPIEKPRLPQMPEGEPMRFAFDDLEYELMRASHWVPSGKLHVLLWLAAGAPGARPDARFGGLTARELLDRVLSGSETDYPPPA